jgi:hypothetical protein
MKLFFFYLVITFTVTISACTKPGESPATPVNEKVDTAASMLNATGSFQRGAEGTVAGTAKVYLQNGRYVLALEDFTVSNGPDLHVYLSQGIKPDYFIDLGRLKSVTGNQVYDINSATDISKYKYALIYCQQYNVLFGSAELK